jgi:hypothetical protein
MTKKEIIDLINSLAPALSLGTVTGNTFAHEQGKIQQWEITGGDTLTVTGLDAGVPAVGIVQMTQGTGGGFIPTLPGNSDDVVYRLEEGDVNILGYLWDGTSLRWDSTYKVTVKYFEDEASSFFAANTGLTTDQKTAVNNLVIALKDIGWSKFKAVYPLIGGSAAAHKWNLINPVDSDAAFRLTFTGGWTHSANGALANGTTGYADTHFSMVTNTPPDPPFGDLDDPRSFHVGYYSRTNTAPGAAEDRMIFGGSISSFVLGWDNYNTDRHSITTGEGTGDTITGVTNFNKLLLVSRESATSSKAYRDASQIGTELTYTYDITGAVAGSIYLAAQNVSGTAMFFSAYECAFACIGAGLTLSEVTALNAAAIDFQTALGRNV